MNKYKTVNVGVIKQGQDVIGTKVEWNGHFIDLNPDFIGYIEHKGNGDEFGFYKSITMKDGKTFNVE